MKGPKPAQDDSHMGAKCICGHTVAHHRNTRARRVNPLAPPLEMTCRGTMPMSMDDDPKAPRVPCDCTGFIYAKEFA